MPADPIDPDILPGHGRVIVAFSGGPDSVCLLHRLTRSNLGREVVCVHIDHGLDSESGERAEQAAEIAAQLGVECRIVHVEVSSGQGPEAEARSARYRALEALVETEDVLVTAHHADDQAETVLLRLVRGAGPEGLAGIPAVRRFGRGWLTRPLLEWERADIERWIERNALPSIRDPANECPDFDRNHLRLQALPALRERWPGVDAALRRSARLCRGAADFIARAVAADLETAGGPDGTLLLPALSDDGDYYRGAAIRAWCIQLGAEPPPGRRLEDFLQQLTNAGGSRCPELRWGTRVLRYWRDRLWLETGQAASTEWSLEWDGTEPLQLPAGLGTLSLRGGAGAGLALTVRSGRAGDCLRPAGDAHRRDCKRLLAAAGAPPWQRDHWPRLLLDGRLVALGLRWRSSEFDHLLDQRGQALEWKPGARPLAGAGLESRP